MGRCKVSHFQRASCSQLVKGEALRVITADSKEAKLNYNCLKLASSLKQPVFQKRPFNYIALHHRDTLHVTFDIRPSHFSAHSIEKLGLAREDSVHTHVQTSAWTLHHHYIISHYP